MSSASYTFTKSILDAPTFFNFISRTLSSIVSLQNDDGVSVTITFASALSTPDASTLGSLVAAYTDATLGPYLQLPLSIYNHSSEALAGDATYAGLWEDVSHCGSVVILALANVASAVSGLRVEFGLTQQREDVTRCFSLAANVAQSVTLTVAGKWMRVVYTNGSAAQTSFAIQLRSSVTQLNTSSTTETTSTTTTTTGGSSTQNINTGKIDSGAFVAARMDEDRRIRTRPAADSGVADSKMSIPLVQTSFAYNINYEKVNAVLVSSGAVGHAYNCATISSGAASNSSATLYSSRYAYAGTGKTNRVLVGVAFGTGTSGNRQMCGIGNASDGLFVGYNGAVFGLMVRRSGVETWTSSSLFNVDALDGSGPSGIDLSPVTGNVYQIVYDTMGYGGVSFGLCSPSASSVPEVVVMHRVAFGNFSAATGPRLSSLPLCAASSNTSNASDVIMSVSSMAAFADGDSRAVVGKPHSIESTRTVSCASFAPLLTLYDVTTYQGISNTATLRLENLAFSCDGNSGTVVVALFEDATLENDSAESAYPDSSVAQFDKAATGCSGGVLLYSNTAGCKGDRSVDLRDYDLILSPGAKATVACKTSSGPMTVSACLTWREDV